MQQLREKHPDRVPIYLKKASCCTNKRIPDFNMKMLVQKDMSVAEFLVILRRKIKLTSHDALYLFVGNTIPPATMHFAMLDNMYRDPSTNALSIEYAGEATFGS
jgi:GABA(A) receptor-associated protein